jgi:hypothetical protein
MNKYSGFLNGVFVIKIVSGLSFIKICCYIIKRKFFGIWKEQKKEGEGHEV